MSFDKGGKKSIEKTREMVETRQFKYIFHFYSNIGVILNASIDRAIHRATVDGAAKSALAAQGFCKAR
jgi:hypothetical protein